MSEPPAAQDAKVLAFLSGEPGRSRVRDIRAATGLTEREVEASLLRLKLRGKIVLHYHHEWHWTLA